MGRARSAIDNLAGMFGNWPFLIDVLRQLDNSSPGGPSVPSPSDVTNWTTYHVDETTGVDQTIVANPLRGQPGTPFRTIAFAINEFRTTYPLANNYNTWANQKFILHLGAGRFTAAVQGASIDLPLLRRATQITGYGAIVESAIVVQNDKGLAPDGAAFNPANVPAPWTGATYGSTFGIEITGLGSADVRGGDEQPGLTLLGLVTVTTFAAAGQTLQPNIQVVRAWVRNGLHILGANLSQSEVPLYAEDSIFGITPSGGSVPTVVGCDGPPGLSAVAMSLSAKRCVFNDRIGPFVLFGDIEDCRFESIRRDLDFAGAPVAGDIYSQNDGAFYNCVFDNPGRGDYGYNLGTAAEVSPRPFRADDNSLVSMANALPTFTTIRSVGLDVSNLAHIYVAVSGSDVVSARGISAVPFATLGAAFAVAQDGDTIHITPGSYVANVAWPAAIAHLNILGEDESNTQIVSGLDAQPCLLIAAAAVRGGRIANLTFVKSGANTAIGGVHVDNATSDAAFCADGLLIENCSVIRNQPGGAAAGLYAAWYVNGASRVTMRGCAGGITETLNADFHAWDCQIYAQGDVPNALTVTGPKLGALTRAWTGSHYHGCEIKGDDASLTPGIRLGGTPWIELDAGCFVSNTIQSLAPLVDANAGALVPRIISRAYYFPNEISNSLQFACTTTEAYVDLSNSIFGTDFATATVGDLSLDAVGSTPRQRVMMQGLEIFSLTIGSMIDGDIRGGRYDVLSATLAAVTGATLLRDNIDRGGTLDGAGAAVINNICPWPTGSFVEVYAQQQTVPGVVLGVTQANMVGPTAGGTLTIGTGTAGAAYSVSARVRRST